MEPSEWTSHLAAILQKWDLALSASQADLLWRHFQRVVEANRRFNLTRILDPQTAAARHYADSLSVAAWAANREICPSRILDIGTGAGFPAAPLAILRPDWSITALDATAKKARFVAECAAELGLSNLVAIHAHSGYWGDAGPEFDLALLRAVGDAERCLRLAVPCLSRGGRVICFRSSEQAAPPSSLIVKGRTCRAEPSFTYTLPDPAGELRRRLDVFRMEGSNPGSD